MGNVNGCGAGAKYDTMNEALVCILKMDGKNGPYVMDKKSECYPVDLNPFGLDCILNPLDTEYIVASCEADSKFFSDDAKSECDTKLAILSGKYPNDMCYAGRIFADDKAAAMECAKHLSDSGDGYYVVDEKPLFGGVGCGYWCATNYSAILCEEGVRLYSKSAAQECSEKLPGTVVGESFWLFDRPWIIESKE